MKYAKRVMSLTLVMGLMVSSLTGCTSSKDDTANKGSIYTRKLLYEVFH